MKKLILHVGYPKAGSTSLQRFMFDNRVALAERGILYPVSPNMKAINQRNIGHQLELRDRDKHLFEPAGFSFNGLRELAASPSADTIIVSAEVLLNAADCPHKLTPLARLIEETGLSPQIVAFVRPQHLWLNSYFAQRTKRLNNKQRFSNFFDCNLNFARNHFAATLQCWTAIAGAELTVLPFTAKMLQPNIETVFFKATGLDRRLDGVLGGQSPNAKNVSPGPKTIEACRRTASRLMGRYDVERDGLAFQTMSALSREIILAGEDLGWNNERFNGLSNEMCMRVRTAYAGENEAFARRYWDASWDDIFREDYDRDFVSNEFELCDNTIEDHRAIARLAIASCRKRNIEIDL